MKKIILFITILLFILSFQSSKSQTIIEGGDVFGIWTSDGSPYLIMEDIIIPDGETLSIGPGTVVEFQGHYGLYVQGRLIAEGSVSDSVVFTINDTTGFHNPDITDGGWNGINFYDTPHENDSSIISYCRINYGKSVDDVWYLNCGGGLTIINFHKVRIENCLFTYNSAGGSEAPSGGAVHIAWSNVKFSGNTFTHNYAMGGGAIHMHGSSPEFVQNTFSNNSSETGGAIVVEGDSEPNFTNDVFEYNHAIIQGGGVMCWEPSLTLFDNTEFTGNMAFWGGAIGMVNCDVHIDHSEFTENYSTGLGGAIGSDFSLLTINNSIFTGDTASMSGAIHAYFDSLYISNCSFYNNKSDFGGAIHSDMSHIEIAGTNFIGNTANNGGAIHTWETNLLLDDCEFYQNHCMVDGGAIEYNADSLWWEVPYTLEIMNSRFIENTADWRFAAARIEQFRPESSLVNVTIDNCEFEDNHADRVATMRIGGGVTGFVISNSVFSGNMSNMWTGNCQFNNYSEGVVYNCLFHNNTSAGSSASTSLATSAHVDFMNCTFANNLASAGAMMGLRTGATASLTNCISWNNMPNPILMAAIDTIPCHVDINYCNIQFGADSIIINDTISTYTWGEGNISSDPLFADTVFNDFRLQDESPCISMATDSIELAGIWMYCPETDIDSNPRPSPEGTLPDMGAYESPVGTNVGVKNAFSGTVSYIRTYPNPFSQSTRIEILLNKPDHVSLRIFNAKGNIIQTLAENKMTHGKLDSAWNAQNVPSGIYYVVAETGDGVVSKKIVLKR